VTTGLLLGAASINIPVVLDDHGTSAAALVAARLSPAAAGYVIALHSGSTPGHRRALEELAIAPHLELGLAQGEGTGACLVLPFIDAAAQLLTKNR
jgi:nicotinate-nucleotide--dimethylbenzimidazole phosphoribosyltransferase